MKMSYLLILMAFFTGLFSIAAQAETGLRETLTTMNRIKPLQHPDYDTSEQILGRRILGRKNQVLGEVQDVVLNKNGNIVSLEAKFDRLGRREPVTLNYNAVDAEPVTNGYMIGFEKAEVEDLYPAMLANIETAAGGDDEAFSLQKLPGTEIRTPAGQRIGKVSDVLFGARGDRAEAFYITLEQGTARGKSLAVPYRFLEITRGAGGRLTAGVTQAQADAISEYAKTQKK